jgi:tRNA A37 threonylcarbamoyladenosine modification protein TsaB
MKYAEVRVGEPIVVYDSCTVELNANQKASTELFNELDQMLARNKLAYNEIEAIYVASGPGSYTAARLLVTIVKTIVFMYPSITVFDASLLDILRYSSMRVNAQGCNTYSVVLARRNKYYVLSEEAGLTRAPQLLGTGELEKLITTNVPCIVNAHAINDRFSLVDLRHELFLEDWLRASTVVSDVKLYEPYYLEAVSIG